MDQAYFKHISENLDLKSTQIIPKNIYSVAGIIIRLKEATVSFPPSNWGHDEMSAVNAHNVASEWCKNKKTLNIEYK